MTTSILKRVPNYTSRRVVKSTVIREYGHLFPQASDCFIFRLFLIVHVLYFASWSVCMCACNQVRQFLVVIYDNSLFWLPVIYIKISKNLVQ